MKSNRKKRYCTYVLYSKERDYIYVGFTSNLRKRLKQHWQGKCQSTKKYRPFILLEACYQLSRTDALRREAFLKTEKGQRQLRFYLSESIYIAKLL